MPDKETLNSEKSFDKKIFWIKYRTRVLRHGIPQSRVDAFITWAQEFESSMPDKPLQERNIQDIQAFLKNIVARPDIEEKQVLHISEALRILYQKFFQLPWAQAWEDIVDFIVSVKSSKDKEEQSLQPVPEPPSIKKRRKEPLHKKPKIQYKEIFNTFQAALHKQNYSRHTKKAYSHWFSRFVAFHDFKSPRNLSSSEIKEFLEYLAIERKVSPSTQTQACNALIFLYHKVLDEPLEELVDYARAKQLQKFPALLTRDEINRLLNELSGIKALIVGLIHGGGLRLIECLRLRIRDVEFDKNQIVVRDIKGRQVRIAILPEKIRHELREHLRQVKKKHDQDLEQGLGEVPLWTSLEKKTPDAVRDWTWQYVFPSNRLSVNPETKKIQRNHIHENVLQKAVSEAARKTGLNGQVSCHVLRNSFAFHLFEDGKDIPSVQELLGLSDATLFTLYNYSLRVKESTGGDSTVDIQEL
jgi:integron integrase